MIRKTALKLGVLVIPSLGVAFLFEDRALINALSFTWSGFCGWEVWPAIDRVKK